MIETKAIELHEKLHKYPHCFSCAVNQNDEDDRFEVVVGFAHYNDIFYVYFNPETEVGEMFIEVYDPQQSRLDFYGLIAVSRLVDLFKILPHVSDFLIDTNDDGIRH